jgi:photosystem II stability/assembly factor-like uncharacterized protein
MHSGSAKITAVLLGVTLSGALAASSVWSSAETPHAGIGHWSNHGPGGGTVRAITIDSTSDTVYAATGGGGVFSSLDGGHSWKTRNNGLSQPEVWSVAVDPKAPGTVYAGTAQYFGADGLYHGRAALFGSTNGGKSWAELPTHIPTVDYVAAVAVDPAAPDVYAATEYTGLFASNDGGLSWARTLTGTFDALAVDPSTPGTGYVGGRTGTGHVVLRTTDGGKTWAKRDQGLPGSDFVTSLGIDPSTPDILYAGTESHGVYRTGDGGASWSKSGLTGRDVFALAIDPEVPQTLFASVGNGDPGLFRSTDGGATWAWSGQGLPTSEVIRTLAVDPLSSSNVFTGQDEVGLFASGDGGSTWARQDDGISGSWVRAVAADPAIPTTEFAAVSSAGQTRTGLAKSKDGGKTWVRLGGGLPDEDGYDVAIDPSHTSTVYGVTRGLYRSTDGGQSWSIILFASLHAVAIDPVDPRSVFVAGTGVYESTDGGTTWTMLQGFPSQVQAVSMAIEPTVPATILVGARYTNDRRWGGMFRSTDGGVTWAHSGLSRQSVESLAIDPLTPSVVYAGTLSFAYKSIDGGATWQRTGPSGEVPAVAVDPLDPSTVYFGTLADGVFVSYDGGRTVASYGEGLLNPMVSALTIDAAGAAIHAGTFFGGVFDARLR